MFVACCSVSFRHSFSDGKFSFPFLIKDVRIWTPAANKIAVIVLLIQNFKISNVVRDFAIFEHDDIDDLQPKKVDRFKRRIINSVRKALTFK